ncbi:DsbA family oxidoreductase [Paenibacillus aceris]|uniref:DsbA family dithiol-disulfide isomerase n=1 Tax=Paenibacillus aceris TaxID=869555 RepID=A0ABS4HUA2_9BACL|nr:DsbA family oxidoreductase [Paenibacillus aceris]MBP1962130.1 putative DsbA family dithiol-disulfide isomerase [Paenibacillus aceris]NHW34021.1 DsbA family oxidoreductase [Paenibacillus aceris]
MMIEIFEDIVCPWCRIGKKNLEDALANFTAEPVEVHFRAYQLDPSTPIEGSPFREVMLQKFRADEERLNGMLQQVTEAGKASGLHFDFSQVKKMPNTLKAHQLIAIAAEEYKKPLVNGLFKAYFEDGKDIGHIDVLLDIAEQLGMDREQTAALLNAKEGLEQVEDDLEFARQAGVTGVPFFVINRKYALTGAQPSAAFLQALEQISTEQTNN